MKNKQFRLFPTSIAASLIVLSPAVRAAAITWDAGGVDNNWSTIANWSDDADPAGDDVTFNATGALASGTTNTVSASESIASLSYNFEDATNQHTTAIGGGQTLTVNGNFSVLTSTSPAAPTNVSISGATGALSVTGTSFLLANQTASSTNSTTSVDMSGLGSLTANVTTFRLGGGGAAGATTGNVVTMTLAQNSTITATTVGVSDGSNFTPTQKMLLGSGTNTINADSFRVGSVTGRGTGEVSFNTGSGSLVLRAKDGVSAATNVAMVNTNQNTSGNITSVINLAGHSVDAKIGTLTMAKRTGTATSTSGFVSQATLSFDQGTLEVGTAIMGANVNAALIGKIDATINIGGGIASFAAVNMADNFAGNTTKVITANLNLTGGTTTVAGDIVKLGTTNATGTVLINGGTLDMTDGNIGSSTNPVALGLQSGTLKNVATINGGGELSKTSAGNLVLSGNNTFTGGMNMFGGEVKITDSGSFGIGTKNLNIQVGAYVNLDGAAGDIALSSGITMTTAGLSLLNSAGDNVINGALSVIAGSSTTEVTSDGGSLALAGNISAGVASARNLQLSGVSTGANTVSGAISDGTGSIVLTKAGEGTWTLTNDTNSFTGNVNVNNGELKITKSGALGSGVKTLNLPASPTVGYLGLDGSAGAITLSSDITMVTAGDSLLNIAGDNVINCPINLTTGSGITTVTSNGGSLDLAGPVAPIAATYRYLELDGTSTGGNTVSGAITDGASYVHVVKKGAGTWALTSASNAYTGNTNIEEGTLSVSAPNFDDASTVSIGTLGGPSAVLNLPNAGTDTVAVLNINGVTQPGGKTYGNASSVLPIVATSAITGPGTITVPAGPGTPYTDWADTFLPGNNVADPAGDNDNDGLLNQQEFAFGLSPIDGSSVNPILVQVNKSTGTFTYQRRAGTGLTYRILTSTDLISWPEDVTAGQVATPSGDNETVVVTLTGAPLSATKLFVRVAAQ